MIRTHGLGEHAGTTIEGLAEEGALPLPHWIEVVEPTSEELEGVRHRYGIPPGLLPDALGRRTHARFSEREGHVLMALRAPLTGAKREFRRLGAVLGMDHLVTVLREPLGPLQQAMDQLRHAAGPSVASPAHVLHTLLDKVAEGFEALTDHLFDREDELEERLDGEGRAKLLRDMLDVRRDLMELSRVVRRQREVCQMGGRSEHPAIPEDMRPRLRDVGDHLTRVHEMIEAARDGLLALRDTHLSLINNRLSETMRVLTVIATLMMPLSLVAGIYGMNVSVPGDTTPWTFWVLMFGMLSLAITMLVWFRRKDWL